MSSIANILFLIIILTIPKLSGDVFNRFISGIPKNTLKAPSYLLLMSIAGILSLATVLVSNGPIMFTPIPLTMILYIIGSLFYALIITLVLLSIGVPCKYIENLSNEVMSESNEEKNIALTVVSYKRYSNLIRPYLFVTFSNYTCQITVYLYFLAMLSGGCTELPEVPICSISINNII